MIDAGAADRRWMELAIELSRQCTPSDVAYSVGAIVVGADGCELARGYSREQDPHVHAEERALGKLAGGKLAGYGPLLAAATIYSTLEPCSRRRSAPRSCTELIIAAGIGRVVFAWREPDLLVADCQGYELLSAAGAEVIELASLASHARAVNAHLGFSS